MKWYLDIVTKRSGRGLEVVGIPQRWVIRSNWKLPADNFAGDSYHVRFLHDSLAEIGLMPKNMEMLSCAASISVGNGHTVWFNGTEGASVLQLKGFPESLVESFQRNLQPAELEFLSRGVYTGGQVFPNFVYVDVMLPDLEGRAINCTAVRVWRPIDVDRTEITIWVLADRDAPPDFKEASYATYIRNFGPGGVFEEDDVEVWSGITDSTRGTVARGLFQNLTAGTRNSGTGAAFPGPGRVSVGLLCDQNQRAFYRSWLEYLTVSGVSTDN
jgi:PAH dioxygenase large subunit